MLVDGPSRRTYRSVRKMRRAGAVDRHARVADLARPAGRVVHVRAGAILLGGPVGRGPRRGTPRRQLALPRRQLVAAQRQQLGDAVRHGRPRVPGDLPPGLEVPLQQWHAKVTVSGVRAATRCGNGCPASITRPTRRAGSGPGRGRSGDQYALPCPADRLVLAARFEEYLTWQHAGIPACCQRPGHRRADRVAGHAVAKRCENIRARYARLGVPGLGGPPALEQFALLLVSTGELTATDLRLLPARPSPG
jgi:hypothetical protein